jgi:NAD(P)-dependent dehydrogenase (short-subunit alcohol dehydrogenase family)
MHIVRNGQRRDTPPQTIVHSAFFRERRVSSSYNCEMTESLGTMIITGGSRGIGAAISRLAALRGYAVAINYQSAKAPADTLVHEIELHGGRAVAIQADVGVEQDILRLFEIATETLGPLSALVNNAAITGGFARVDSVDSSMLAKLMAINVTGTILCSREAVRRMSTKHGGKGGAIVNISSRAAQLGSAGEWVHYAATKGAINSFTIGLAREVASESIRVNVVAPGLVDTDLHAANGDPQRLARLAPTIPMGRPGTPHEIAEGALWLLSPAASFVTGTILTISGGR